MQDDVTTSLLGLLGDFDSSINSLGMSELYGSDCTGFAEKGFVYSARLSFHILAPEANLIGKAWHGRFTLGQISTSTPGASRAISIGHLLKIAKEIEFDHKKPFVLQAGVNNHNIVFSEETNINNMERDMDAETIEYLIIQKGAASITDNSLKPYSLMGEVTGNAVFWPNPFDAIANNLYRGGFHGINTMQKQEHVLDHLSSAISNTSWGFIRPVYRGLSSAVNFVKRHVENGNVASLIGSAKVLGSMLASERNSPSDVVYLPQIMKDIETNTTRIPKNGLVDDNRDVFRWLHLLFSAILDRYRKLNSPRLMIETDYVTKLCLDEVLPILVNWLTTLDPQGQFMKIDAIRGNMFDDDDSGFENLEDAKQAFAKPDHSMIEFNAEEVMSVRSDILVEIALSDFRERFKGNKNVYESGKWICCQGFKARKPPLILPGGSPIYDIGPLEIEAPDLFQPQLTTRQKWVQKIDSLEINRSRDYAQHGSWLRNLVGLTSKQICGDKMICSPGQKRSLNRALKDAERYFVAEYPVLNTIFSNPTAFDPTINYGCIEFERRISTLEMELSHMDSDFANEEGWCIWDMDLIADDAIIESSKLMRDGDFVDENENDRLIRWKSMRALSFATAARSLRRRFMKKVQRYFKKGSKIRDFVLSVYKMTPGEFHNHCCRGTDDYWSDTELNYNDKDDTNKDSENSDSIEGDRLELPVETNYSNDTQLDTEFEEYHLRHLSFLGKRNHSGWSPEDFGY
jgi:hypothetical protein